MAGDFQIVGPLFEIIDATTQTFVTDISSRVLMEITPVVSVGLTLSFIAYGMLVMRGAIDMPVADFLTRSLRIGIIVSIALAGGLYQSQIADAIMATPDALAQAITGNPTGISAANIIDNAAEEGGQYVNKAYEKAGFFSSEGITYTVIGTISLFRSEEHTSELQSRPHLVCRLLLEKKNTKKQSKTFEEAVDLACEALRKQVVKRKDKVKAK